MHFRKKEEKKFDAPNEQHHIAIRVRFPRNFFFFIRAHIRLGWRSMCAFFEAKKAIELRSAIIIKKGKNRKIERENNNNKRKKKNPRELHRQKKKRGKEKKKLWTRALIIQVDIQSKKRYGRKKNRSKIVESLNIPRSLSFFISRWSWHTHTFALGYIFWRECKTE